MEVKLEAQMIEKRRSERRTPHSRTEVYDSLTGQSLGQLGNVTPEGLMLIGQAIAEGSLFQLSFALSDHTGTQTTFDLGATCLWSLPAANGTHWSGLQIIDISEAHDEALRQIYTTM